MRLSIAFALFVSFGVFFRAQETLAEQAASSHTSKPLAAITGTDSNVKKAFCECISESKDWSKVFARHLGKMADDGYGATVEVDFDRCVVIAMFRGEMQQVRRIAIDSVAENSDAVVVRFSIEGYGIANQEPPKPQRPYAFIVLPKTTKPIVLEEKIWDKYAIAHGRPPQWKEWARLVPGRSKSSNK